MKVLDSFEMLGTYHPVKVFHSRRLKSSVSILSYPISLSASYSVAKRGLASMSKCKDWPHMHLLTNIDFVLLMYLSFLYEQSMLQWGYWSCSLYEWNWESMFPFKCCLQGLNWCVTFSLVFKLRIFYLVSNRASAFLFVRHVLLLKSLLTRPLSIEKSLPIRPVSLDKSLFIRPVPRALRNM